MAECGPVIFVDDERHIRLAAQQTLELAGFDVRAFADPVPVLAQLSAAWPGVIVTDIKMPRLDGLEFMARVLAVDRDLPVIFVTGHGDISMAVGAMRDGAYDFLEKPFAAETLVDVVRRAVEKRRLTLENRALRQEIEAHTGAAPRLIGNSPAIERLRGLIARLADIPADVLIHGETGTGKDLVARLLHQSSRRRAHHFVAVNCGAVPESIIESELFGHEPGAFTGAQGRRIGKFEHSSGGTLFLDEIESMPLSLQVRLLRVLQDRTVERLGSNQVIPLDLRVVAATKRDLRQAIAAGTFREDLFYRLNVVTVELPPLRERREDVPALFQHFAQLAAARIQREEPPTPSPAQRQSLLTHSWPGNVRELHNVAERFVLLGEGCGLDIEGLVQGGGSMESMGLPEQVECFERSVIAQELARQQGSLKDTMRVLRLPRKTLYDKMRKYGLDRTEFR